ncbi:MAG: DUF4091 domain-containing protein [Bacteroidaceae bacterium]|nr:DUF4091 domain-containing protein [Bacteroidaceae bacterium]
MKRFFVYLLLATFALHLLASSKLNNRVSMTRVDPFEKLLPDTLSALPYSETEEVAAGENAVFQFALCSEEDLTKVSLSFDAFTDGKGHSLNDVRTGFVDYVHVGLPMKVPAKDIIKSPTGMFPDPIVDDGLARDIPAGRTQPLWVSVKVPTDAAPGLYTGTIRVKGKGFSKKEKVSLKVYPVVMEEPDLWVTNWFKSSEQGAQLFDSTATMYSDRYWDYIREVASWMKECHQNMVKVPITTIDAKKGADGWKFDFTHFDQMVSIFMECGVMKRIEGDHLGGRVGGWESTFGVRVPGEDKMLPLEDKRVQDYLSQFIPALTAHLREKGWDKIYYQHIADEPISGSNAASYVAITRFVKELAPEMPTIEACHSHDLAGMLDIWVPQLNFYAEGYDFYRERQQAGDEVWFYTCVFPQEEYANRFIEQPLLKTRLLHWINFRFGATGYLHWGFNQWRGNDDLWYETSVRNEGGLVLPGGDCWIIYPRQGRLYGSIRLEAMRDGIGDYTLLQMLSKKDKALADELCSRIVSDWTKYDMSTSHFRAVRHEILEALGK